MLKVVYLNNPDNYGVETTFLEEPRSYSGHKKIKLVYEFVFDFMHITMHRIEYEKILDKTLTGAQISMKEYKYNDYDQKEKKFVNPPSKYTRVNSIRDIPGKFIKC